ncbi:MAG: hypothetical protein H7836_12785 [Magnetococcus sp. YQC-3]
MYCKYVTNTTATSANFQINLLADLVALLTGEVTINNLSSSCDKVASSIVVDTVAGWTLHDNAAGTNAKCLKAPLADDSATFKYMVIDTNTVGYVLTKVYETWDAATHTGTNKCNNSDTSSYSQQVSYLSGVTLHIFATVRFILMNSLIGSTWGSSSNSGGSGCFERTRNCTWDTVAAGYPPFLFANLGYWAASATQSAAMPRKLLRTGVVNSGATALVSALVVPFGEITTMFSALNGADQKVQNTLGVGQIPLLPIMIGDATSMPIHYGEISSLCDVWALPQGVAANMDTIVVNSVNYLVLQAAGTTKLFAARKG